MHKTGNLLIFLIFALTSECYANCDEPKELTIPESKKPQLILTGSKPKDFVPSGWRLVEEAKSDFNLDGLDDIALAIVEDNPKNIIKNECQLGSPEFDSNPYAVLVALKQKNSTYQLVASDLKIIPRLNDPVLEQPYSGIEAKNGVLSVSYHYWQSAGSWYTSGYTYKFRYQDGCMRLIGHDFSSFHRASGEETSISTNFLTGNYIKSNSNSDKKHRVEKKYKLTKNPKYCLGDVAPEIFEQNN